jgi:fatty acid desaturase
VIGAALYLNSWLPLMYVLLPTMYGGWLSYVFGLTQHVGLAEDELDHRKNCRTIYMNPVFRFFYSDMNYHLEHHMFPMVPYHALAKLHEEIKDDCPPPYDSLSRRIGKSFRRCSNSVKIPLFISSVRSGKPRRNPLRPLSSQESAFS